MKELVFASNNAHKVREIREMLGDQYRILSLADIGFVQDIAETADTLEGNALLKARTIHDFCGKDVFADDTGLEVYALNMEPGVYSARYAGMQKNDSDNMSLLLQKMEQLENRSARFRTAIALIMQGKSFLFEGIVEGRIAQQASGSGGFGYDPIFIPENENLSFAEMSADEKNRMSHRGRALQKLRDFLQ
jgi:XTP/dITP diphosphohydrolase